VMLTLVALVLGLAKPPAAYLQAGPTRVPLAISSWCWGARCGAPISASTKVARVTKGSTIQVQLAFVPTRTRLAVAGVPVVFSRHGTVLSWRATRSGGLSLNVTGTHGWVTYVGRIAVHS
jgi:hypothetical protein